MRTTMRALLTAVTVLGVTSLGAVTAQAHDHRDGGKPSSVEVEVNEFEFEFAYEHEAAAIVKDSQFVYIDQSATNVVFGDLVLD